MIYRRPPALAARKPLHQRHHCPVHEVQDRSVVEPDAGEKRRALLKIPSPNGREAEDVDVELKGSRSRSFRCTRVRIS